MVSDVELDWSPPYPNYKTNSYYAPTEAAKLLAAAGYEAGRTLDGRQIAVTLQYPPSGDLEATAATLANAWRTLGITVETSPVERQQMAIFIRLTGSESSPTSVPATATARPPTATSVPTPPPTEAPLYSFNATGGYLTRISKLEWVLTLNYEYSGYAGPSVRALSYYGFRDCIDSNGNEADTTSDMLFNLSNKSTLMTGSGVAQVKFRMKVFTERAGGVAAQPTFPVRCSSVWLEIQRENGNSESFWKLPVATQVFTTAQFD